MTDDGTRSYLQFILYFSVFTRQSVVQVYVIYYSTILDKYKTSTTGEVQTVLRIQVSSVEGIRMSYQSSADRTPHQLNILINIPLRSWTHLALQVAQSYTKALTIVRLGTDHVSLLILLLLLLLLLLSGRPL